MFGKGRCLGLERFEGVAGDVWRKYTSKGEKAGRLGGEKAGRPGSWKARLGLRAKD